MSSISNTKPLTISVVIPVYNGARTLDSVLAALSKAEPAPDEILVVDDGSTDGTGELAALAGRRVIRQEQNVGAAAAKNRGAEHATGEIILFTDADILVPTDIFKRLRGDFEGTSCDAIVGLLALEIPFHNFPSEYKNLWMNYTYSRFFGQDRIGLFYTSCAAIRRERFMEFGCFDENYRGPSTAEDTEFGQRAWALGATVRLDRDVRAVHLKRYSLAGLLTEDFHRAAALTRMRLRKWRQPFFTSVPLLYQLSVPCIYVAVSGFFLAVLAGNTFMLLLGVGALLLFLLLNMPFTIFLARQKGPIFAAKGLILLPADALVVGFGIMFAAIGFALGRRY